MGELIVTITIVNCEYSWKI